MPITPLPDANFVPPMKGYSGQGAFRFWCQTVLPIVYDDSLSYYELLNKVVVYLNNTISDVANMEDNVEALANTYAQLENYVNTYFDSLDVQQEINNKLDEMASDGTLTAIVRPIIGESVTEWLDEHVTPTSPVVDDSFTIAHAAADSKSVGDKTHWWRGGISSGLISDRNTNGWWTVGANSTIQDLPVVPNPNLAYLEVYRGTNFALQIFRIVPNDVYIRSINVEQGEVGEWFHAIDNTLTISGSAADAKVVGDKAHWLRGSITNELLSSKVENGWWSVATSSTSTDLPYSPLDNLSYLHVYRGANYALQIFMTYPNKIYTREVNATSGTVGEWHAINENSFSYRGVPDSGLLSDYKENGWYTYISTVFDDRPIATNNHIFLKNYYSPKGVKQVFEDVYGRFTYYRWITSSSISTWRNGTEPYATVANNINYFVEEMNKKANKLGMTNTTFVGANGLSSSSVSTPLDLCKLVAYAANEPVLCRLTSLASTVIYDGDTPVTIQNTTDFAIFNDRYSVIFCKTGHLNGTPEVYNYLCVATERNTGVTLAGAVMMCSTAAARFTAMRQLFDRMMQSINGETVTVSVTDCDNYCGGQFYPGRSQLRVISTKNQNVVNPTASTAKTMTCLLACEYAKSLGAKMIVRPATQAGGSGDNLTTDNQVTVLDAIADAMLPSSNTAANVLADYIGDFINKGSRF